MRFASLGSGSQGNALLVESGSTRILLDCGFGLARGHGAPVPARRGAGRPRRDHRHPRARRSRRRRARGSRRATIFPCISRTARSRRWAPSGAPLPNAILIDTVTPFAIGAHRGAALRRAARRARAGAVRAVATARARLGVLTDTGRRTPHIARSLSGVDALVLECNHDLDMLMNGPYPASLKHRVAGRMGHLANAAAAELLQAMDCSRLQHLDRGASLRDEQHAASRARGAGGGVELRGGVDRRRDAGGGIRLAGNSLGLNRQDAETPRRQRNEGDSEAGS